MPEDSKKKSDKKKNEPKEQRKPRHSRNQAGKSEKPDEIKSTPKVSVPQKPVYEDPGPEFYKNLKRETEEIVKITEAENAKYRKKEIQSNWAKYEMPIESYEDVDEQDVGADYEKLIQTPLSAGGHFQFKHEKSWDTSSAPSLYDKYFEINMDSLSTAISTVPFYERNDIDQSLFSETDLLSMNNRASKYKLKYLNDNTYSTSETDAQEKIISTLKENLNFKDNETEDDSELEKTLENNVSELDGRSNKYDVNLDFNVAKTDSTSVNSNKPYKQDESRSKMNTSMDDFDDELIFKDAPDVKSNPKVNMKIDSAETKKATPNESDVLKNTAPKRTESKLVEETTSVNQALPKEHPVTSKVNPVIESPEDLEKWLDDFLDS